MENKKEKLPSASFSWYPGHMAKTKKQIIQDLKLIDVVVEIRDARIPISSHNPDIAQIIKNKKRIIILNKADLADENENKKWVKYFEREGIIAILADCNLGKGVNESISAIKKVGGDSSINKNSTNELKRTIVRKKIRVMVIGIPNVGKSSYINRITKKVSAKVGNKPGVTRQKQWIKLDNTIELLDTPGVLWPKFETNNVALNLAFTGTIKDDILDRVDISYELLKILMKDYIKNIETRYKIENFKSQTLNPTLELMEQIGINRGALMPGGKVDLEKTANIILDDFQKRKIRENNIRKSEIR